MRSFLVTIALLTVLGCAGGSSNIPPTQLFAEFKQAVARPLASREQSAENSRVAERLADSDALQGKTRTEVEEAIGRGDDCSRHPNCAEAGFEGDDWFYQVGEVGEGDSGAIPQLIVGFDRSGHVTRVWNLRTH